MQNIPESPAPPSSPSDIPSNIDDVPIMSFEQFRVEVDSLIMDMLLHPQGEQLLSDFAQMLREIGIPIWPPVDMHNHSTDGDLGTSSQADTSGSFTESDQMAISTSTDVAHEELPTMAFDDPAARDF